MKPGPLELVLCADGRMGRVTLVRATGFRETRTSGSHPDSFVTTLRRRLTGSTLCDVHQPDGERLLSLTFRGRDALGDPACHVLHVEMTGRHGNLILVDDADGILEADRRIPPALSRVRQILPGMMYRLPPRRPGALSPDRLTELAGPFAEPTLAEALCARVTGMSRRDAADRLEELGLATDRAPSSLTAAESHAVQAHLGRLHEAASRGHVSLAPYGTSWRLVLAPPAEPLGELVERLMSKALETWKGEQALQDSRQRRDREIRQAERERAALEAAWEEAREDPRLRREADLILTWTRVVEEALARGAPSVTLTAPETGEELAVAMAGGPTAAAEAARRYRALRRAATRRQHLAPRREAIRRHLEALRAEVPLTAEPPRDAPTPPHSRLRAPWPGRQGLSSDGWLLLAGRSPAENDKLLRDVAGPEDWWFHAERHAGAHILARPPVTGTPLPPTTLLEAATWAAVRSRGHTDHKVAVLVTQRKHLRKVRGLPAGKVLHQNARTVMVRPDAAVVARLEAMADGINGAAGEP